MPRRVAIVQSNYIPWKGYFDLIASVDEFIIYDDVQYTRRDWRNRNKIKTPQGLQWLTVPVKSKGKYHDPIREIEIDGDQWLSCHWKSIVQNYSKSPYFDDISGDLGSIFLREKFSLLHDLNKYLIDWVCSYLSIQTKITTSGNYILEGSKSDRLASLCKQAGATHYVSGPSAKSYLDESAFSHHKICVEWFDYSDYPEYAQLWGNFVHEVSIIDLLFNCGLGSAKYMKFVDGVD